MVSQDYQAERVHLVLMEHLERQDPLEDRDRKDMLVNLVKMEIVDQL